MGKLLKFKDDRRKASAQRCQETLVATGAQRRDRPYCSRSSSAGRGRRRYPNRQELGAGSEAIELLRPYADVGDRFTAGQLANLLVLQGHLGEGIEILCACADAGDEFANGQLVRLLAGQTGLLLLAPPAGVRDRD